MDDFRVCLNCDYKKGFHVSFRRMRKEQGQDYIDMSELRPTYDLGWTTLMIKSFKAEKGLIY
jgi:hypothetical protein